jgi:linoleoyl-CoA desaturase
LHGKALVILGLFAISFATFVLSNWPIPVRLAGGVGLVVSLIAVGTGIMHDANHGAFSRLRWLNATLAYSSDALGASSWLWRIQHNTLHHGNTNVVGYDSDLALGPLARLAPSQPWQPWYRAQHVYLWPLYGFLALKNLLVSDVVSLVTKRMEGRPIRRPVTAGVVARVVAGKLFHLGWAVLLPLVFNSWWVVLTAYLVCSWAVGFVLAVTFQLAHCTAQSAFADADAPRRGDDFTLHQLRTTCDVDSSPVLGGVFRWLVGGLDHQIEHHLGPRLPHTAYAAVARRFREQCRVHGVEYHVHAGVWAAVRAHGRWLREMGRRTETAGALSSASWVNEPA